MNMYFFSQAILLYTSVPREQAMMYWSRAATLLCLRSQSACFLDRSKLSATETARSTSGEKYCREYSSSREGMLIGGSWYFTRMPRPAHAGVPLSSLASSNMGTTQ